MLSEPTCVVTGIPLTECNCEICWVERHKPQRMVGADRGATCDYTFQSKATCTCHYCKDRRAAENMDMAQAGDTAESKKLDAGKAPVRQGFLNYFPRAILAVAYVSEYGFRKYHKPGAPEYTLGWLDVPNGEGRFGDADARHTLKPALEGPYDSESGLAHLAHKAWNAMAELEIALRDKRIQCRIGNYITDGKPVPDSYKAVELD